ncbi:MAG: alpha/beta hydrolase [Lachnospiraceae bacterium]|nr:alpha/beta hydrolase [Lachnospiraceae bacterium]
MEMKAYQIGSIPAILYGAPSEKGYLFIHGQDGSKEEAAAFAQIAVPIGYQVLGIDLPQHGQRVAMTSGFDPWTVVPELQEVLAERKAYWKKISLRANSIGAYFSMLALGGASLEKALFVSPIVHMEQLILDMMGWAGVTKEELQTKGEIPTNFGQTLSWPYLCWVRQHPLDGWKTPTSILYAGHDNLTSRQTVTAFVAAHKAELTVYEEGEHWFHTPDQCAYLSTWEQKNI